MSERRPHQHLLIAALLLVAQTVLAWHAPSHIFDSHRDSVAQHDCQALHGHGMATASSLFITPPPAPAKARLNTERVLPPFLIDASVHLARAPPRFS